MPYIESLFYYTIVITLIAIVVAIILFVFILLINFIGWVRDGRSFNWHLTKIVYKWYLIAFFLLAFSFYIFRSFDYYGSQRAYPQAKAYAIVGDTVSLAHAALLGFKINYGGALMKEYFRIIYPDSPWDKKIQAFQSFLLEKMYRYIPPEDGERELWYYKYKLRHIATMNYKFMRRSDYESVGGDGSVLAGHGKYTPRQKEVHNDMLRITNTLRTKPMKDKVFDQVDRYMSIFRMSYYISRHYPSNPDLKEMKPFGRYKIFEANTAEFKKYLEYIIS